MEAETGKYTFTSQIVVPESGEEKQEEEEKETPESQKVKEAEKDTPQDKEEKITPKPLSQDEITNSELDKKDSSNHSSSNNSSCKKASADAQPGLTKIQSADNSLVIANQPRRSSRKVADCSFHSPFNDAHSERDWTTKLCLERTDKRSNLAQCCCWPAYRYGLAVRLGETPFMPLIPCAAFALRIKIRSLFGIKGSLIKDFFTAMCCEPCAVCQMTREMDQIGL